MQTAVPAGTAVFRGKWKRTDSRFAAFGERGGASLSFLRTEMPLRDIPVFRMAYFPIPHRPTFGAPVFRSAYSASRNARAPAASRPSVGGGSFAPPCTPLSRRPPDTGRTASKAPLEGSWRAAPEGWVRHGDAQFRGIEERRFRLRLTGLHAFCQRQRLWNQSVWPSRTCRAKALMSEKAGQSRPAPPASPSSCTSEPAVMSR